MKTTMLNGGVYESSRTYESWFEKFKATTVRQRKRVSEWEKWKRNPKILSLHMPADVMYAKQFPKPQTSQCMYDTLTGMRQSVRLEANNKMCMYIFSYSLSHGQT